MPTTQEYVQQLRRTLIARQIERVALDHPPSDWEREEIENSVAAMTELQLATAFGIRSWLRPEYLPPAVRRQNGSTS